MTTTNRNSDSNNRCSSFSGSCDFSDLRALRAKLEFPSQGAAKSLFQIIFIASTPKLIRDTHIVDRVALRYARPSRLGMRSSQPHVDRLGIPSHSGVSIHGRSQPSSPVDPRFRTGR